MNIIKIDVQTFIRLLELSREDIKDDADLHFLTQRVTEISKEKTVQMEDYDDMLSSIDKVNNTVYEMKRSSGIKNKE